MIDKRAYSCHANYMRQFERTISDDLNFYSLLGVLQSGMWLKTDIEEYLRPYALSHGRFSILLSLSNTPNSSLIGNELSNQLGVSKATISRMIQRLFEEGYLICDTDRVDLRKKRYTLAGDRKSVV